MPYTERLRAGIVEITFDSSSADSTYQLPATYIPGKRLRIRRTDSSSHNATVTVASGGSIDGTTDATLSIPPNGDAQIEKLDGNAWETYGAGDLSSQYTSVNPAVSSYTYNADGTVATETVSGITTTYTYNADGTVATSTRAGVTRTYTYNADGTIASVA